MVINSVKVYIKLRMFYRILQKRQSKIDSVVFYSGVYSSTHQLENIEFTTKSEAE